MTITANMVSLSLSTVGPPGADSLIWGGGLAGQNRLVFVLKPSRNAGFSLAEGGGGDAGIPASVRTVVGDGWLCLLAQQGAEFLMRCVVLLRIEYAVDTIAVEQASQQPLADRLSVDARLSFQRYLNVLRACE